MTWEELKEKAKEMGYKWGVYFNGEEYLIKPNKNDSAYRNIFEKSGTFNLEWAEDAIIIGSNLSPEQMLMIMRGLE